MSKSIVKIFLAFGIIISFSFTFPPLQNYEITYITKNPDGQITRVIKYYMLDGKKFRSDFISNVQSSTSVSVESSSDLSGDSNNNKNASVDVKSQVKQISNLEPHTIEILRKDKNLVWILDPSYKDYREVQLRPDVWDRALTKIYKDEYPDLKKTGEAKLLNFDCSLYESVQKVKDDTWINKVFTTNDNGVVLKTELWQNGKLVETMEALEFNNIKPSAALFEIPEVYSKQQDN